MELVLPFVCLINYNEERRVELELVDVAQEKVRMRMIEYRRQIKKVFDKHILSQYFQSGDLILRKVEAINKQVGKLDSFWKNPFWVVYSHNNEAYKLKTLEGKNIL
jgi:hypothetical protein